MQLTSRLFQISGDHYGFVAKPLIDLANHRYT